MLVVVLVLESKGLYYDITANQSNHKTTNAPSTSCYTYPGSSPFLIEPEVETIHAIANSVALDPLVSIVSSLSCALDDDCPVSKVNLEPLASVVITRNPRAIP